MINREFLVLFNQRNSLYFYPRILETLRSENRIMDGLAKLDIKDDKMKSILHLDIKTTTDTNLLDIRDPSVVVSDLHDMYAYFVNILPDLINYQITPVA